MARSNDDEAQSYRAEIDAAGFDGVAAHFRESADDITGVLADRIDSGIAEVLAAADAATRDTLRSLSRTLQEAADLVRRQHGI